MADYPRAYAFFENEITLPLHTKLSDEEVDYIIETFKTVSEKSATSSKNDKLQSSNSDSVSKKSNWV